MTAIADAIDRLHLSRHLTAIGHSLGTIIGARSATVHPRRVSHLVRYRSPSPSRPTGSPIR